MIDAKTLERWGYTLEKHAHYSPRAQAAVRAFHVAFGSFQAIKKIDWNGAMYWSNEAQAAWNRLAKCRREETGYATYLNPIQYQEAMNELAR